MNPSISTRVPSQFSIGAPNGSKNGIHLPSAGTGKPVSIHHLSHQRAAAMVHAISILSPAEQKELVLCESIIEKGWETFVEVGRSLTRIRDQKLYRAHSDTFEIYCRERFQYGKSHVYRLIGAAEAVTHLSPSGDSPVPTHEGQVRPLIGLSADKAQAAWQKAVDKAGKGMVTAKLVRDAVAEVVGGASGKKITKSLSKKPDLLKGALDLIDQAETSLKSGDGTRKVLKLLAEIRASLIQATVPHK